MRAFALALIAPLLVASCSSHADNVCEDIGDCSQGGNTTFIQSCQNEAKALRSELATYACDTYFDEYYACADATFQCSGATSTFACNAGLSELNACIARNSNLGTTACATLAAQQAKCTTPPAASGPPLACTLARDCEAQCVLSSTADVCAPRVDELDAIRACGAACPPAMD